MNNLFKFSTLNKRNYINAQTNHFMSKPIFGVLQPILI